MKISDIWKKQALDLTRELRKQFLETGLINAADVEKVVALNNAGGRCE